MCSSPEGTTEIGAREMIFDGAQSRDLHLPLLLLLLLPLLLPLPLLFFLSFPKGICCCRCRCPCFSFCHSRRESAVRGSSTQSHHQRRAPSLSALFALRVGWTNLPLPMLLPLQLPLPLPFFLSFPKGICCWTLGVGRRLVAVSCQLLAVASHHKVTKEQSCPKTTPFSALFLVQNPHPTPTCQAPTLWKNAAKSRKQKR